MSARPQRVIDTACGGGSPGEAGIPFAGIAIVTDHDAGPEGIDGIEPVTQEEVFAVFEANLAVLRWLLLAVVAQS